MRFVDHSNVQLIKSNASDLDVARAAWVSNIGDEAVLQDTTPERLDGLINFLYREHHMSPFEHGSFTFFIDTPIFVAREFMRHRTFSYNETSARYRELEPVFYMAPDNRPLQQTGKVGAYRFLPGTDWQHKVKNWATQKAYKVSWRMYKVMLKVGVAREVARNVLPVGIMTQFYATVNPRNLMQFLTLRNDDNALYEIREVAAEMEAILSDIMPFTYNAFKTYDWRTERQELEELREKLKKCNGRHWITAEESDYDVF